MECVKEKGGKGEVECEWGEEVEKMDGRVCDMERKGGRKRRNSEEEERRIKKKEQLTD